MDALDEVVKQGKVLYLGISDTPAYIVAAANTYAKAHNKTPFSIYQGRWNLLLRDMEREVIPMCRHFGMAIAPWDSLGGGRLQSKKQLEERRKQGEGIRTLMGPSDQTEIEVKASEALEEVAREHGIESLTAIALAYVMSKAPRVFPLVGGRKVEHLHDNIQALKIKLSDAQIKKLESVTPFEPGFPNNFVGEDPHTNGGEMAWLMKSAGPLAFVQSSKPISHE